MITRSVLTQGLVLDQSYEIRRVIGAGGFGITYEALDRGLGRGVALKEFFPAGIGTRDGQTTVRPNTDKDAELFGKLKASFIREARTLSRFEHPAIVRVFRVFERHGTAYMVMSLEQGATLKHWLEALDRRPTQDELDRIVEPLLGALEQLHTEQFLHRDIAPDNIIIHEDLSPVLLDFGATRRVMAELTSAVTSLVKRGYSPMEQYAVDTGAQGPWSDIYSLGATLYRAVAGHEPQEATLRMLRDARPPAAEIDIGSAGYRPGFLAGIDMAMALRPEDRPQSVAELRRLLFAGTWREVAAHGDVGRLHAGGAAAGAEPTETDGAAHGDSGPGKTAGRSEAAREPAGTAAGVGRSMSAGSSAAGAPRGRRIAPVHLAIAGAVVLAVGVAYAVGMHQGHQPARTADAAGRQPAAAAKPATPSAEPVAAEARQAVATAPDAAPVPPRGPPTELRQDAPSAGEVSQASAGTARGAAAALSASAEPKEAAKDGPDLLAEWKASVEPALLHMQSVISSRLGWAMSFAALLRSLSDEKLLMEIREPGALVPEQDQLDAVSDGRLAMGWSTPGIWWRRTRALDIVSGAVPAGLDRGEFLRWLRSEGAAELNHVYQTDLVLKVHSIPCGLSGAEGLWMASPVETADDFKGRAIRTASLPLLVMREMGAVPKYFPQSAIVGEFAAGNIVGAEWSDPASDLSMALWSYAKNYYYPSFHAPAQLWTLDVNLERWTAMTVAQRGLIAAACERNIELVGANDAANSRALGRFLKAGVEIRRLPDAIVAAARDARERVFAKLSANDAAFKRVWQSYSSFK